nr:hypothetical protein [Nanoarchaeum sp.]
MVNYKVKAIGGVVLGIAGLYLSGNNITPSIHEMNYPEQHVEASLVIQEFNSVNKTLEIVTQKSKQLESQRVGYDVDYELPGLESLLNRNFESTQAELDTLQQYKIVLEERAKELNAMPEIKQYNDELIRIRTDGFYRYAGSVIVGLLSAVLVGFSLADGINGAKRSKQLKQDKAKLGDK